MPVAPNTMAAAASMIVIISAHFPSFLVRLLVVCTLFLCYDFCERAVYVMDTEYIRVDLLPFVLNLLEIIVPTAATIIAFVLGRRSNSKEVKNAYHKEQLDRFYVPFVTHYVFWNMWLNPYSKQPYEKHQAINRLIQDNYHFMSASLQRAVTEWNILVMENYLGNDTGTPASLDTGFCDFTKQVFQDYRWLRKQLLLPKPALPPLPTAFPYSSGQLSEKE